MSSWIPRTTNQNMDPSNSSYWDASINPGATFYTYYPYPGYPGAIWCNTYNLALPNCTTYCLGRVHEQGCPSPLQSGTIANANNWHSNLVNGWTAIAYSVSNVEPGDILEWSSGSNNHVAVVEKVENGTIYISESAYTDDNGYASGDRTDTVWGSTKTSVYNKGIGTWPNRFFHYGSSTWWASGNPTYILKNPNTFTNDTFKFFQNKKTIRRRITKHV